MKSPTSITITVAILCIILPSAQSFFSTGTCRNTIDYLPFHHDNRGIGHINPTKQFNTLKTLKTLSTLVLHDSNSESAGDVNAYPDSRRKIAELKLKVDANLSKDVMNMAMLKESVRDMEQESSQPGFWDSQEKAQDLLTEMNRVKALVERVEYWQSSCEDVDVLLDMAAEDPEGAGEC